MNTDEITTSTQYLTFTLETEVYAVNISKVREVLDYTAITKVPNTPEFLLGVINLRGSVVPVADMRTKFGLSKTEKTVNTSIIIMDIALDGETTVLGALVDAVREVIDMEPGQIEPPPRIGTRLNTEFIKGMGKREDMFIIILNIDKVFSLNEIALNNETNVEHYTMQAATT